MADSQLLTLQAVAERLGLPLELLRRRVEAGDVPAQRLDYGDRVEYLLRLSDLGIEEEESGTVAVASDPEPSVEERFAAVWHTPPAGPPQPPAAGEVELLGRGEETEEEDFLAEFAPDESDVEPEALEADLTDLELADAMEAVPPPSQADELTLFDYGRSGPRSELATMMLDPRELVGGLLDRWERTLEQRIYAEQRQRFQGELVARHNLVKQLQMELKAERAEHAAMQAEKDRVLSEMEHDLADAEREIEQLRAVAEPAANDFAPPSQSKRRRWFFGR